MNTDGRRRSNKMCSFYLFLACFSDVGLYCNGARVVFYGYMTVKGFHLIQIGGMSLNVIHCIAVVKVQESSGS